MSVCKHDRDVCALTIPNTCSACEPGSVTSQAQRESLADRLQADVRTVQALDNTSASKGTEQQRAMAAGAPDATPRFSLQVSAEMAFAVSSVRCPSHTVKAKRVGTKAMVRLAEPGGGFLRDDFVLHFNVAMPHASRMWIEEDPQRLKPPTAMVAFYPRMPEPVGRGRRSKGNHTPHTPTRDELPEYTFFLDRSASMEAGGA